MSAVNEVQEATAVELGALLYAGAGAVVTLAAGETRLAAHRSVLAARSPVFQAMFRHDTLEAISGQVSIADVEGPVLRQLLAHCYTLQGPQLPSMAPQLLIAADKYGLLALKEACEQQVAARLSVENAAAAAVLAVRHSCPSLTAAAVDFIRAHDYGVMATQGWADAVRKQPEDVIIVTKLLSEVSPEIRRLSAQDKVSRLVQAAMKGELQQLRMLLAAGVDVEARDEWGSTALHYAAFEGHVESVRCLLAAGAELEEVVEEWQTALHWAALNGHVEVARCLLEAGAEVDPTNGEIKTPLHWAARFEHVAMVRLLLGASADPNARDHRGRTPLRSVAKQGHAEVAAVLLAAGADSRATDNRGLTPLDTARQHGMQQLIDMLTQCS